MRLKQLSYAAAIMSLGAVLGACSSESMVPEPDVPVDKDTDFYINVQIANPGSESTRDGDYEAGTIDTDDGTVGEQTIKKILFVFYNSDKQYVGNATYDPNDASSGVEVIPTTETETLEDHIEKIMTLVVPVTIAKGSTKPAFVMAYVNPTNNAESDLFNELPLAIGSFRELYSLVPKNTVPVPDGVANTHEGFSMNNAVHFENTTDDEPRIAVPLDDTHGLYSSVAEAKAGTHSVTIYVERVVAKVKVIQNEGLEQSGNVANDESTLDDTATHAYTLIYEPLGWGLSNLEKYTYIVKNFRSENVNPTDFTTAVHVDNNSYVSINDALNNKNDGTYDTKVWNLTDAHRSFWALSPTYYNTTGLASVIPTYSDQIYPSDGREMTPRLIYRSFNDIYNITSAAAGAYGKAIGTPQYTLEHTMRGDVITNYQGRAVTSAVIVGRYKLQHGTEAAKYPDDNFYIRKYIDQSGQMASFIYPSDADMKKAFLESNSAIYIKQGTEYIPVPFKATETVTAETVNGYMSDFSIYHPGKDILGATADGKGKYIASRYVTLKLDAKPAAGKYYFANEDGTFTDISELEDLTTVNRTLYENLRTKLGGIEMYYKGYAYFEVPVEHLWRQTKKIGDDGFEAKLGQYGIVRNHTYTVQVKSIQGIGTGISDPNAPIVPNTENDSYAVRTEIKVQKWRVVPPQQVDLKVR